MQNETIERTMDMNAPVARVWRALTDYREFGRWFRVELEGPFEVGRPVRGKMTYPGFEGLPFEAKVEAMEPERRFVYTWPPYSEDPDIDVSGEPWTTVEFRLEPTAMGTRLTITESGFGQLSPRLQAEAYRSNEHGWTEQLKNISNHVTAQ